MLMPAGALGSISRGFSSYHAGIDLAAPMGSSIQAAAAGTVTYAGWYNGYGNMVDIRHDDGLITRYAHMSAYAPELGIGTPVKAGQMIGVVGQTGHAHGNHIHFEVRYNGRAIDPAPFIGVGHCVVAPPRVPVEEAYAPPPVAEAPQRRIPTHAGTFGFPFLWKYNFSAVLRGDAPVTASHGPTETPERRDTGKTGTPERRGHRKKAFVSLMAARSTVDPRATALPFRHVLACSGEPTRHGTARGSPDKPGSAAGSGRRGQPLGGWHQAFAPGFHSTSPAPRSFSTRPSTKR